MEGKEIKGAPTPKSGNEKEMKNKTAISKLEKYIRELKEERAEVDRAGLLFQSVDSYYKYIEDAARIVSCQVGKGNYGMMAKLKRIIQTAIAIRKEAESKGFSFVSVDIYFQSLENAAKKAIKRLKGEMNEK